jgi:hypothetical protein
VYDIGQSGTAHAQTLVTMEPLVAGTPYYFRVAAWNGVDAGVSAGNGYGPYFVVDTPVRPVRSPDAPTMAADALTTITAQATPIQTLFVKWGTPATTGGSAIEGYKVEWWTARRVKEVQRVRLQNTVAGDTSGTFNLYYNGAATQALSWDVSAADMRAQIMKINGYASIGDVSVSRDTLGAAASPNGYEWLITFNADQGDIHPLVPKSDLNAATGTVTVEVSQHERGVRDTTNDGNYEVQVVTVARDGADAVSGFFRLSLGGSAYSEYIRHDASETEMTEALENLPTVGKVEVNKDAGVQPDENTWRVTFLSNGGNQLTYDQPQMEAEQVLLVDGTVTVEDGDNAVNEAPDAGDNRGTILCAQCVIGETPDSYNLYETSAADRSYMIDGLTPGVEYYVRVSAKNQKGYGSTAVTAPTKLAPPQQVPGPPASVATSVKYGVSDSLLVNWSAPESDGGSPPLMYRVEWDQSEGFGSATGSGVAGSKEFRCPNNPKHEVHVYETVVSEAGATVSSGAHGSFWTIQLTRSGVQTTTQKISWNAVPMAADETGTGGNNDVYCVDHPTTCDVDTALTPGGGGFGKGSLQSHLESLSPNIMDGVEITRSGDGSAGNLYAWTVTFMDDGNDFDVSITSTLTASSGTASIAERVLGKVDGITYSSCTGEHEITGLEEGRPYFVRVLAYNAIGYGLARSSAVAETPRKVPGPPQSVSVDVYSGTALRVTLSSPASNGGATIEQFKVEWDSASSFDSGIDGAPLGTHIIMHLSDSGPYIYRMGTSGDALTMGTPYYTRVSAYNDQGYGAAQTSTPAAVTPMQLPSAPTNVQLGVTSSSMLTVHFEEPEDIGGSAISQYLVTWDRDAGFSSSFTLPHKGEVLVDAATDSSYTIESLSEGTSYYVKVQAINAMGEGTAQTASPRYAKPEIQVPGKPWMSVLTQGSSAGSIDVAINPPSIPSHGLFCSGIDSTPGACATASGAADGGSSIVEYVVQWDTQSNFASGNGGSDTIAVDTSQQYVYSVEGLHTGVTYFVRVYARNAAGTGASCNVDGLLCDGDALSLVA